MPLSYHARRLAPSYKKAVPVSDRVLRSQVANKLVVKHKFRGVGSHALSRPMNGLDFD